MATFYVETSRPPYPARGIKIAVHKAKDFSRDVLSPCMTAVFQVDNVQTKQDAIASIIERAAGFNPCVRLVFGGKNQN